MGRIDTDSVVDMIFNLRWHSESASHTDCYQASGANIWRDIFPAGLRTSIMGKASGERVELQLKSGDEIPAYEPHKLITIKSAQFGNGNGADGGPKIGRFYPKGLLKGVSGVFRANIQPFRCVNINNGDMTVDFNHPIAGKQSRLACTVGKVHAKKIERGGTSVDWIETLTEGPGMQARWQNQATDYFFDHAFERKDERPDKMFYERPRLVQHIDDTAIEMVQNTYGRFLDGGMRVLDLMSSWQSHTPAGMELERLVGLGMNAKEMESNRHLSEYTVQDLNVDKILPFAGNSFDAVLNTVSVEYLTDPIAIFREVARVLRPGGYFIVTFSNRWFPSKAVGIWEKLHEFERMGLVSEYFLRAGGFRDLHTFSIRGLPRPSNDKYFTDLRFSDPVFAVWGQRG